jgi:hypothetical protein
MSDTMNGTEPALNRLTPAERFNRDPNFNRLVSMLEMAIHHCEYTPTEIREAAMLAVIRYETMHCRQSIRMNADGSDMLLFNSQLFRPGSQAWELCQGAWTDAVGQPDYRKDEWLRMERALHEAAQKMR